MRAYSIPVSSPVTGMRVFGGVGGTYFVRHMCLALNPARRTARRGSAQISKRGGIDNTLLAY